MPTSSFMARFGARLVANGYAIIPIQPGTKKPGCHRGGGWRDYPAWTRHAARATTDLELQLWSAWPDAGTLIAPTTRKPMSSVRTIRVIRMKEI